MDSESPIEEREVSGELTSSDVVSEIGFGGARGSPGPYS